MKQLSFILCLAGIVLSACTVGKQEDLKGIAEELCQYVPDHQLLERSRDYMTDDFYALLDTMFNLPEHEAMDHEWLYYFVTGNGGTIADFSVDTVEMKDATHAIALLTVRQMWEDSTYTDDEDAEEHRLYMEKVDGKWLMSDFDEHKQDCIRHIAIWRKEEAQRQAISDYLAKEIGRDYLQGEVCIPVLMLVATEDDSDDEARIWGDFWVFNYNLVGDTLKTVSGGNHSGCMYLAKDGDKLRVTHFEQTEDGAGNEESAKRIFGSHYDVYQGMHSNEDVREAVRQEQLRQYIQANDLQATCYQDYGWDAVKL